MKQPNHFSQKTAASTDGSSLSQAHLNRAKRWKITLLILAMLFISVFILSINIGFAHIPFPDIVGIIVKHLPVLGGLIDSWHIPEAEEAIVLQVRAPRIVAGALVGLALSTAGVAFQGIFRNPMADPYVIGSSAGAAVGAASAVVLGLGVAYLGMSAVSIFAFFGALASVFIVYSVSRVGSRVPVTTLLLSGITVSIFLSAIVTLLKVFAGERLHALIFWLMGSFSYVEWRDILATTPLILIGVTGITFFARDLNMILLGEDEARHLGVDVEQMKKVLLIFATLATAASVSISGLIGFVGLIIPHTMRILVGPDHRILIPASLVAGSTFLILCDSMARVIFLPAEIPVGVVTSLSGGPFFIYLLRRRRDIYTI